MLYSNVNLYSPLSINTVGEGNNQALLLQFILSELFLCLSIEEKENPHDFVFSSVPCFFPYDWSYEVGCLNKIQEHARLFPYAFLDLSEEIAVFDKILKKLFSKVISSKKNKEVLSFSWFLPDLSQLYFSIEPFLNTCKENEDLRLFLDKNKEEIGKLTFSVPIDQIFHRLDYLSL